MDQPAGVIASYLAADWERLAALLARATATPPVDLGASTPRSEVQVP
jgi:hypothetical protein